MQLHCHLYFLGLKARVYTEDIQVTHGIFHALPLESIAIENIDSISSRFGSPGPGCSKGG